jgi:hypothetical protein
MLLHELVLRLVPSKTYFSQANDCWRMKSAVLYSSKAQVLQKVLSKVQWVQRENLPKQIVGVQLVKQLGHLYPILR